MKCKAAAPKTGLITNTAQASNTSGTITAVNNGIANKLIKGEINDNEPKQQSNKGTRPRLTIP